MQYFASIRAFFSKEFFFKFRGCGGVNNNLKKETEKECFDLSLFAGLVEVGEVDWEVSWAWLGN